MVKNTGFHGQKKHLHDMILLLCNDLKNVQNFGKTSMNENII